MTERRSIRIEIPLPSGPALRRFRFSLKSIAVLVFLFACGLAVFRYATEAERSRHDGGYYQSVFSTPDSYERTSIRYNARPDLRSLLRSQKTQGLAWPPKIWIKRPDAEAPELERRIDIEIRGNSDAPSFLPDLDLRAGDTVYIDFGRMPSMAKTLQGVASMHGVTLQAASQSPPASEPKE